MNRTHAEIIERPSVFARAIGADPNTVKAWKRSDSIPAPYWWSVKRAGLATLEELAQAAAKRRIASNDGPPPPNADGDSAESLWAFMRNSPLADLDLDLERTGRWRDLSDLFDRK